MSNLSNLLPKWYENVLEMQVLMETQQESLDELRNLVKKTRDNQFVATADEATIAVYEKMLKINKKIDDDLELRRFRVLNRLAVRSPYTENQLDELLSIFGDKYSLDIDYNAYKINIESNFEKYGQVEEIENRVYQMIPANMELFFDNRVYGNPKGGVSLSNGLVAFEVVLITHDFIGDFSAENNVVISQGSTSFSVETITNDYQEEVESQSTAYQSGGNVVIETVEIKMRGDFNGT